MNAPASIRSRRDDYIPAVERTCPWAIGEEKDLRCSMMLIRDNATSAMRRCGDEAHSVLSRVEMLANRYSFERMPLDELRLLRATLIRLTSCASSIEGISFRLCNPKAGGTDASD